MAELKTFDQILDKPWIDFFRELDEIKKGDTSVEESPLYRFAQKSDRIKMDNFINVADCISLLKQIYQSDKASSVSMNLLPIGYNHIQSQQKLLGKLQFAKTNGMVWYDHILLQDGTNSVFYVTLMIILKRFREQFKICDFLFCYEFRNDKDPYNPNFYHQLVASRLNYVLNGSYLPIIGAISTANVGGDGHFTSFMVIPSHDEGNSSASAVKSVNWHFIHINSNGDENDLPLVDFPYEAFEQYKLFLDNQEENITSTTTSLCWENIQRQYGTCTVWSSILIFVLFRLICGSGPESSSIKKNLNSNSIQKLCGKFRYKMTNDKTIDNMNELIMDLKFAITHLIVKTFDKLEAMSGSSENTKLWQEFLHGKPNDSIKIDAKIFDLLCRMENYTLKNTDKIINFDDDHNSGYDSDTFSDKTESEDKSKRKESNESNESNGGNESKESNNKKRKLELQKVDRFMSGSEVYRTQKVAELHEFYKKFKLTREFKGSVIKKIHFLLVDLGLKPGGFVFSHIFQILFYENRKKKEEKKSFGKYLIHENIKKIADLEMIIKEKEKKSEDVSYLSERLEEYRETGKRFFQMLEDIQIHDDNEPIISDAKKCILFFINMEKLYKLSKGDDPDAIYFISDVEDLNDDSDINDDYFDFNDDDNVDDDDDVYEELDEEVMQMKDGKYIDDDDNDNDEDEDDDDDDEDDDDEDEDDDDDEDVNEK